jgi:spore coat protein U-like protein
MKRIFIVLMAIAMVAAASGVMAATVTSNFNATATVISTCRISTAASTIAFGNYDPTDSTALDASGSFGFRCTKGTTYRLYITGTRTMTSGTNNLTFELYSDAGRTTLYPSASGGATPVVSGNNNEVTSTIYGRVSALQDAAAASYTAPLVATVEY